MVKILIGVCFLSSMVCAISQNKPPDPIVKGNWSAELRGGWKAALSLSAEYNDRRSGTFFWLFDKQDIHWSVNEGVITVQFKDAWHLYSEDSATLKFKNTSAGLKLLTDGMSNAEKELLEGTVLKPGRVAAHQLGDSRYKSSPYNKYHDRGRLTLDANVVSLGFVETAVKLFQSGGSEISVLVRHREMPVEVLRRLMKTTTRTKDQGHRKSVKPWQGASGVLLSIASHPNLERKDLEVFWNLPFTYWEPVMWWKVVDHPNADPAWREEFKQRVISKSKEAERMRNILAKDKELDLEILDILLELYKADKSYRSGDLAAHPKLDAVRMRKIYSINPYDTAGALARRGDTPLDILQKIVESKDERAIIELLRLAKAPQSLLEEAALKLSKSKELNWVYTACESKYLSPKRVQELLPHREPGIRCMLARNPTLPLSDLKKLVDDDYQLVAQMARQTYLKRVGGGAKEYIAELRKIEDLKRFTSLETEVFESIRKDDPEWFFDLLKDLWLPLGNQMYDSRYKRWVESAVKYKAHKVLKQWMTETPEVKTHLLKTHAMIWTPEIVEMILDGKPSDKEIEEFISRVIQGNRVDIVNVFLKRGFSLKVASKRPLVWYAVAHRNDMMVRKLLKAGCDSNISNQGTTPAMLAVQTNYTAALDLLPLNDSQKKALQAFKDQYPGDPHAVWLGAWTNGKSEFKTLAIRFLADGNGRLITATGMGTPIVWKPKNKNTVQIFPLQRGQVVDTQKILAHLKGDVLELVLPGNRTEKMRRPESKKK